MKLLMHFICLLLVEAKAGDMSIGSMIEETVQCTSGHSCTAKCTTNSKMEFNWDDQEVGKDMAMARAMTCCSQYKDEYPRCSIRMVEGGMMGLSNGDLVLKKDCMPFIRQCRKAPVIIGNSSIAMAPAKTLNKWEEAGVREIEASIMLKYGMPKSSEENFKKCIGADILNCNPDLLPQNITMTGYNPCMICKSRSTPIVRVQKWFTTTGKFDKCIMKCECAFAEWLMDVYYRVPLMPQTTHSSEGEMECWGQTSADFFTDDFETKMMSAMLSASWTGRSKKLCAPVPCTSDTVDSVHTAELMGGKKTMVECSKCIDLRFPENCDIQIKSDSTGIVVSLTAPVGTYNIQLGDFVRKGEFMEGITERIPIKGAFKNDLKGHCNSQRFERPLSFTLDEYCNSHYPGLWWMPSNTYCKYDKTILRLACGLILSVTLYFGRNILSSIVAVLISLLVGSCGIMTRSLFTCPTCKKFRVLDKCHFCNPTTCTYCGEQIMNEENLMRSTQATIRDIQISHMKRCKSQVSRSEIFLSYLNLFRFLKSVLDKTSSSVLKLAMVILGVWLLSLLLPGAWAESLEDVIAKGAAEALVKEEAKMKIVINLHLKKWEQVTIFAMVITSIAFLLCSMMSVFPAIVHTFLMRVCCKKGYICQYCYSLYNKKEVHLCKRTTCPRCGSDFSLLPVDKVQTEVRLHRAVHMAYCMNDQTTDGMVRMMYAKKIQSKAFKASGVFMIITICFILIIGVVQGAEKDEIDDKGLFAMPKDPVNFGKVSLEKISVLEQKVRCNGPTCKTTLVLEATAIARRGRAFGYEIIPKEELKKNFSGNPTVIIKVEDAYVSCKYTEIYRTGKPTHRSTSQKTCKANSDCDDCQNSARSSESSSHKDWCKNGWCTPWCLINDYGTNRWACDGSCMLNGGGGCTCGICSCYLDKTTHTVLKKVKEEPYINLCYDFGGKVRCAELGRETRAGDVFVIKTGDSTNHCPNLLVKDDHGYYTGPINDIGEFDNKFGAFQAIGEPNKGTFTKDGAGGKCDVKWHEKCDFGYDAEIMLSQCCHDTFDYIGNLQHLNPVWMKMDVDVIHMRPEDVGTWVMQITMPDLIYVERVTRDVVSKARIVACKGCYNCNEGGSCNLEVTAGLEASVSLSCDACSLDKQFVHVVPGTSILNFNIFCHKEKVELNCTLAGNYSTSLNVVLDVPPQVPHGDSKINVEPGMTSESQDCSFFGCLWDSIKGFFSGGFAWVKWILIAVATLLVLVIVVKLTMIAIKIIKMGSRGDRDLKVYFNDKKHKT